MLGSAGVFNRMRSLLSVCGRSLDLIVLLLVAPVLNWVHPCFNLSILVGSFRSPMLDMVQSCLCPVLVLKMIRIFSLS